MSILIAVSSASGVNVAFVRNAVVVIIGITRIDQAITISVRLTCVENSVTVAVWALGLVCITFAGNAIPVTIAV